MTVYCEVESYERGANRLTEERICHIQTQQFESRGPG